MNIIEQLCDPSKCNSPIEIQFTQTMVQNMVWGSRISTLKFKIQEKQNQPARAVGQGGRPLEDGAGGRFITDGGGRQPLAEGLGEGAGGRPGKRPLRLPVGVADNWRMAWRTAGAADVRGGPWTSDTSTSTSYKRPDARQP
jgi:hypothetical protein